MRVRTSVVAVVLLLAGCGEEADTPTITPNSAAPTEAPEVSGGAVAAPPIEDAAALRDDFLILAEANATDDPGQGLSPSWGIVEAWTAAYPDLQFNGSAIPPTEDSVSVYSNVQNSKNVPGADNPYVLSVAILDTQGTCAGAVAVGFPSPDTFLPADVAGEEQTCDPQTVAAVAGYETFG